MEQEKSLLFTLNCRRLSLILPSSDVSTSLRDFFRQWNMPNSLTHRVAIRLRNENHLFGTSLPISLHDGASGILRAIWSNDEGSIPFYWNSDSFSSIIVELLSMELNQSTLSVCGIAFLQLSTLKDSSLLMQEDHPQIVFLYPTTVNKTDNIPVPAILHATLTLANNNKSRLNEVSREESSLLADLRSLFLDDTTSNSHFLNVTPKDLYFPTVFTDREYSCIVSNVITLENNGEKPVMVEISENHTSDGHYLSEKISVHLTPSLPIALMPLKKKSCIITWPRELLSPHYSLCLKVRGMSRTGTPYIIPLRVHRIPPESRIDAPLFHFWVDFLCVSNQLSSDLWKLIPWICRNIPSNRHIQLNSVPHSALSNDGKDVKSSLVSPLSGEETIQGPFGYPNLENMSCCLHITLGPLGGFPKEVHDYQSNLGESSGLIRDDDYIQEWKWPDERKAAIQFKISATTESEGWGVVNGETLLSEISRETEDIRWHDDLIFSKSPKACCTQCIRLVLVEVNENLSVGEVPAAAGFLTIPSTYVSTAEFYLNVIFHVYETFSLYDRMDSPNLVMRDVKIRFTDYT